VQEAGIYVLEACGFDSIPIEMGLLHAKKQFDGMICLMYLCVVKPFVAMVGNDGHFNVIYQ